ncbi:sensor domain-containing diguanylate cyclase [Brenneria uluponensis]|uniref:sensor domain-containing diguanylate cyclase n=1 Tax=Brenneria uluponensis TaxID=3057057 RepID=UPI0028E380B7|nr:sensor domain-containing diguanylate cyclase [Brenneria ulupoensis]
MQHDVISDLNWLNKKRAIASFAIMLLIAFLIISWSSYEVASHSVFEEIEENSLPLTSDNVYSEIQRDLLRPIFISSLMAHDTFLKDWALNNESDSQAMIRYLKEIDRRFSTFLSFFASDKTKLYYDPHQVFKMASKPDEENQWFFDTKQLPDNIPYSINIGHDPEVRDHLDIFINHKVLDYQGNFIGVVGIGLSVASLKILVEKYEQRYNRTIYFINDDGEVMLHGGNYHRAANIHQQPGIKRIATAILTMPGGSYQYRRDNENIFLNTRFIPEFGWRLMIEQSSYHHEHQLWIMLLKNLFISIFVSVLFLLLMWLTIGNYQRRLETMATTDKLTGLMNRQAFEEFFRRLRALRFTHRKSISIILIDIDYFKQINDRYGHGIGDRALQNLTRLIQRTIRSTDKACRWGGEEFVILLDGCSKENALQRAETLRRAVDISTVLVKKHALHFTVSCGVAELQTGENLDMLLNRADIALYQAKDQGRNKVVMAEE